MPKATTGRIRFSTGSDASEKSRTQTKMRPLASVVRKPWVTLEEYYVCGG